MTIDTKFPNDILVNWIQQQIKKYYKPWQSGIHTRNARFNLRTPNKIIYSINIINGKNYMKISIDTEKANPIPIYIKKS